MAFISPNIASNTDLVTFTVKIDGKAVSRNYRILQVFVSHELNRLPTAIIVIADGDPATQDFMVSNSADFIPGKYIKIQAGYHSIEETIFDGVIIKHGIKVKESKPSFLFVECKDVAYKMTVGRKNRSFDDSTDSDLITEILAEYGLAIDVDPTSDTHEKIIQYNVTDWDLINMRAEMNSLFVNVNDGQVEV